MKLISFVIPSYNSQDYLHKCIDSIVVGGQEVEVIVVNDGSKDQTEAIAQTYVEKYPGIVSLISKPNGGHGSTINEGLKKATGLYFKVVDSDDWLNKEALDQLLVLLRDHVDKNTLADAYVTNVTYDKPSINQQFLRQYRKKFPKDTFFTWEKAKRFYASETILMHAILYKTTVLKESQMVLPLHTFYVDNIYTYKPLPFIKTFYYLDVNLYNYFIGRADQSVNFEVLSKRYDQQIRVMKELITAFSYEEISHFQNRLRQYMIHYLESLMYTTHLFIVSKNEPIRKKSLQELWHFIKVHDPRMYTKLRFFSALILVNFLPWGLKRIVVIMGYNILKMKVKLG